MIRCEVYRTDTGMMESVEPAEVATQRAQSNTLLWVDVEKPTESELSWLAETFHLHPLAMEDVRNPRQRSKVDRYDEQFFFVMRAIHYHGRSHRIDSVQLDTFIGTNYLLTVHQTPLPPLISVHKRWQEAHAPGRSIPFLFYMIADAVVDSYFPVVDALGECIDTIDSTVFANPDTRALQEIFLLRRSLLTIRKLLGPLRDALNELMRAEDEAIISVRDAMMYLTDVFDHVLRLTDFVDTYRDMLSGSLEAYQSSLANKLNTNMQRLTVAATVLATSTVITGFFGMNLQGLLINSNWRYGGLAVLLFLLVITAVEIYIFHRKRWL